MRLPSAGSGWSARTKTGMTISAPDAFVHVMHDLEGGAGFLASSRLVVQLRHQPEFLRCENAQSAASADKRLRYEMGLR